MKSKAAPKTTKKSSTKSAEKPSAKVTKKKASAGPQGRASVRFKPDPKDIAQLQWITNRNYGITAKDKEFKPDVAALIVNESFRGCCVVITNTEEPLPNMQVVVKVGPLAPLLAHTVWVLPLDQGIFKIGLEYEE